MTRRLFYFLLCIGVLAFTGRCVSAQELGTTPVLFGFAKQEKQGQPDYLPPVGPGYLPSEGGQQTGRLPQVNEQSLHFVTYIGGLSICLVVFRLAHRKRENQYRGSF